MLVATRVGQHRERIESEGLRVVPIRLVRGSKNIVREALTIFEFIRIYRRERPELVHHVGIKPVLYGSWAGRIAGIPCIVNALGGLGSTFVGEDRMSRLVRQAVCFGYRSLPPRALWIFQNPEDLELFIENGIVRRSNAALVRGVGVDSSRFNYLPEPDGIPTVLFASRMLWHKGVAELIAAAKQLRKEGVRCRVMLVGSPDPDNPASIDEEILRACHAEGVVEWLGHRDDIPRLLANSHIVVLPTYLREGVPKILIEAAFCGRPIVATNVPGCREIVCHEENGLLVPARDVPALVQGLMRLLQDKALREKMGKKGRELGIMHFSQDIVIEQTLALYQGLLGEKWPGQESAG